MFIYSVLSSEVLPVKLTNGLTPNQGIVEVFYGGVSGLVCGDNQWNLLNAHVVCRQLGYDMATSTTAILKAGSNLDWYWIGDVTCIGNETRLFECSSSGFGNAKCDSAAMVTCGGKCPIRCMSQCLLSWAISIYYNFDAYFSLL